MFVRVDCGAGGVTTLEEPENFTAFHVELVGTCDARGLDSALTSSDIGSVNGDRALIKVNALTRLAEGRVGVDWHQKLDGMVGYAVSKGWWHEESASIIAHIEGDFRR